MQEIIDQLIALMRSQLVTNQFLSGGIILGAISTMVYSLRSIPQWIWSRIERRIRFEVTIEQNDDLFGFLQHYLNHHYSHQLRNVKANFWRVRESEQTDRMVSISSDRKNALIENTVCFNQYGDNFNIWWKKRLISVQSGREKLEHAQNISSLFYESYVLSGIFAKKAIKNLLDEAVKFYLQLEKERIVPYIKSNRYENWETDRTARMRDIDKIFIDQNKKTDLLADLKNFVDTKEFYHARCIPYRRGYLFYGPPGTGKSSLASAVAKYLKRDLYMMNLKSINSDSAFLRLIDYVQGGSILLIEDADTYFNGRQNESSEDKVNFSTFINAFSGVSAREDMILIITTNHKSLLDEALLRAGRLDMHIEIGRPTAVEVKQYLRWFYGLVPLDLIQDPISYTMADVENICIQNKTDYLKTIKQLIEVGHSGLQVIYDTNPSVSLQALPQ